ncbi:MAG: tyrosine-type recombinase/integrase, partial [Xanthobacteraceae bacterium]
PAVQKLRPGKVRREIPDGGCAGLYLIIQPSGAKSWALRFRRPGGTTAKLTLGPVDLSGQEATAEPVLGAPLTLAGARRLAADLHHQRAKGRDIVAAKHRERLEREARGAKTFAAAAADFITQHAKRKTRCWLEQSRLLGLQPNAEGDLEVIPTGLSDRWCDRPIAEIDGDDVHGIVDEVREHGVPGLERRANGPTEARARAMFGALSMMFHWLIAKRRLSQNPCTGVARPDTPEKRDRVLSDAEIIALWRAADVERSEFGAPLKLLLLTGSRLNEVTGMRRAELSDDGATWTLPKERVKNRRTHVVPLPPLARTLIESVPTTGDLVFTTDGAHPVVIGSKIKHRLDAAMNCPPWRIHDLRRTAATGLAEIGIAPHIVEACLNHISGAKAGVAGVYNRAAYAPEKAAALIRWATHVDGLVSGRTADVTPMTPKARAS